MKESKLSVAQLKKERLRKSLMKAKCQASDILAFTLSWRDLESHFESIELDLVKRSQEIELKEKHLEKWSDVLKTKEKLLEKRAREFESAGGFKRHVEEKQKKLDRLQRWIESDEKKRFLLQKLNRERKFELKWTGEQVDALQKKQMNRDVERFKEKSYKEMSEEQQEKYEEILKKTKLEEKKLRGYTRDLALKEGELRGVNMLLTKRNAELEWKTRKIDLEKSKMNVLRKRNEETERKQQHMSRALEEKQKEIDLIEKRLRSMQEREGRGTSGD